MKKFTEDLWKVLSSILKDSSDDLESLHARILQKPVVYQITQDNRLEYDSQTMKELFGHMDVQIEKMEDKTVPESIEKCGRKENENIREMLSEKIKTLEVRSKGKSPGSGFNMNDWEYFCPDMSEMKLQIEKIEIKEICEEIDEIGELKICLENMKFSKIQEVICKREDIKCKIRRYLSELEDSKS